LRSYVTFRSSAQAILFLQAGARQATFEHGFGNGVAPDGSSKRYRPWLQFQLPRLGWQRRLRTALAHAIGDKAEQA
jgi:hypothetical protein